MKTLSSSTLLVMLISIFASCKKDLNYQNSEDSGSINGGYIQNSGVTDSKKPLLIPSQNPGKVNKGNTVSISYTATNASTGASLQCGRVVIYQWLDGEWKEVASGNAPTVSISVATTTADDCAYKFRAGFNPGGTNSCRGDYSGVDYLTQQDFCADVVEPCVDVFTIAGDAGAVNLQNGLYEFTITYTLTSPVDVAGVKFQGGATAGGRTGHAITDIGDFVNVNVNNNNTVLKWEGDLKACSPVTLTFKYTRNFSCPASDALVTGSWSAVSGGVELANIAELPYSCN